MPVKVIWDYTFYWSMLAPLYFADRLTDIAMLGQLRPQFAHASTIGAEPSSARSRSAKVAGTRVGSKRSSSRVKSTRTSREKMLSSATSSAGIASTISSTA